MPRCLSRRISLATLTEVVTALQLQDSHALRNDFGTADSKEHRTGRAMVMTAPLYESSKSGSRRKPQHRHCVHPSQTSSVGPASRPVCLLRRHVTVLSHQTPCLLGELTA